MLSFLGIILIGSVLLSLPVSSASGKAVPYIDALFTATTSTCVTGLVTLTTATAWSTFGHIVILLLIQVGGLGVITIMCGFMLMLKRRMSLSNRILIQDAFNLNTLSGLAKFVKKVLLGTFLVEGAGALLYMLVFVPQFGARGIWISVFNSISAFCNAGIDIIGSSSLIDYATNPIINMVTCALIILGGLGYVVWWDLALTAKALRTRKLRAFRGLTLHSKIALCSTLVLILAGGIGVLIFEWSNPATIGKMSLFDKLQVSFFQSVTTRTAGFATIPQENLTNGSAAISLLLMFIGGSPVGTAGGVKTVTIAVLIAGAVSAVKGTEETSMFNRTISKEAIRKATAVVCTSFGIMFASTVLLCAATKASFIDIAFETVSATATVGLSRNLTTSLNGVGKAIIIATMYLGRVGPISLAFAFKLRRKTQNIITNPTEQISVG